MSNPRIRVGIIGLNPGIHWAAMAHVPALGGSARTGRPGRSARRRGRSGQVDSGGQRGGMTDAAHAYLYDVDNGATLLSIPLGHTLAGFRDVLGDFRHLSARLISRRQTVDITDTRTTIPTTTPDQVLVQGTLDSGAAFSIHYRGGVSRGTNLLWEINGTEGDIQVTAASGHAQLEQLTVTGANGDATAMTALMPPASTYERRPDTAVARNVARTYALIAQDIRQETRNAPSFRDAVALHGTLEAIERSAAESDANQAGRTRPSS